ncbi:MAG: hypothetical protein JRN52_05930 [Nitrososphaerota archaeon]|nr:hypothetical protein [Nitrososphaerota archaeon]
MNKYEKCNKWTLSCCIAPYLFSWTKRETTKYLIVYAAIPHAGRALRRHAKQKIEPVIHAIAPQSKMRRLSVGSVN